MARWIGRVGISTERPLAGSPDEAAPGGGADDELLDGGVRGELDDRLGHVVVVQHHVLAVDLRHTITEHVLRYTRHREIAPCKHCCYV